LILDLLWRQCNSSRGLIRTL